MAETTMLVPQTETDIDPVLLRQHEEMYHNGPIAYNENRAIFSCPKCGRNYSMVIRIFEKYVLAAGLSAHYSLHSLRHTYATYLRTKGASLDIVQKLLGHASSCTTDDTCDHSLALHFRAQADLVDFEPDTAG